MPPSRALVLPALAALLPLVALVSSSARPAGPAEPTWSGAAQPTWSGGTLPAATVTPERAARSWLPPVDPVAVVRGFDPPDERWGAGHRGVDLRAAAGTAVRAPADGVVAFVGVVAGRPVVSVDHPGGLRSTYEPVVAQVARGRPVRRGGVLGTVASADHCAGGCLHWGVRRGDTYVDPMRLLTAPSVVLLPLPAA